MENPATWGRAEHVIAGVIDDAIAYGPEPADDVCGFSLPRRIADALRQEGLLKDKET